MKLAAPFVALALLIPQAQATPVTYQKVHNPPLEVTMVNDGELNMIASFGGLDRAGGMFIYTSEDILPTVILIRTEPKVCTTQSGKVDIAVMDEVMLREYSKTGKLPKDAEVTSHDYNQVSFDPRDRAILWTCREWFAGSK